MKFEKNEWKSVPLCELSYDVEYGLTARAKDSGDAILLRITDINDNGKLNQGVKYVTVNGDVYEKYEVKKNDILIARSGATAGKSYIHKAHGKFVFASYLLRIQVIPSLVAPDFLIIFLNSPYSWKQLGAIKVGTAQPNISATNLRKISVPIPSLEDQKQIVELFQSVDHAVEQVEMQLARIGELKKSMLFDLFSKKKQFSEIVLQDDYESIRFGSLASNISERVEPKKTDLSIYVGLEHLETDNLVIEKTGSPNDVVGTKLKVSKGDIIFGKRRAYLRKVAVSHFEGIASAHSMVLRPNEQKINRDFLPYFMQSDEFMNRAIQISEGSLSPTIKWKTLAAQEFVLPRKDKQPKLVELFKQLDETRELLRNQKNNLIKLKHQLLNEILG